MGNPVSQSELEKALDGLIMQDAPPFLEDTDVTISRVASRAKCGITKAERLLKQWEAVGKVEYIGERRVPRGHKVKAWKVVT